MIPQSERLYRFGPSTEEGRPRIDFEDPQNVGEAFDVSSEVLWGERPQSEYLEPQIFVDHPQATEWDCYLYPGASCFYSNRAKQLLEPYCKKCIEFYPARLNGAQYWCIKVVERVPWVDNEQSKFTYYENDPDMTIDKIIKFVFRKDLIDDPSLFLVPETWNWKYCTESLKTMIEQAGLRGFSFEDTDTLTS